MCVYVLMRPFASLVFRPSFTADRDDNVAYFLCLRQFGGPHYRIICIDDFWKDVRWVIKVYSIFRSNVSLSFISLCPLKLSPVTKKPRYFYDFHIHRTNYLNIELCIEKYINNLNHFLDVKRGLFRPCFTADRDGNVAYFLCLRQFGGPHYRIMCISDFWKHVKDEC